MDEAERRLLRDAMGIARQLLDVVETARRELRLIPDDIAEECFESGQEAARRIAESPGVSHEEELGAWLHRQFLAEHRALREFAKQMGIEIDSATREL